MTYFSHIRSVRSGVVLLGLIFFMVEIWEPSTNFVRAGVQDETVNTTAECIHVVRAKTPPPTISYICAQTSDDAIQVSPGVPGEHSSVGISLFVFHSKVSKSKLLLIHLVSNPPGFRPQLKQPPIPATV